MPFKSEQQRRYIYAAASRGEKWAITFIRDSGHTPPPVKSKKKSQKKGDLRSIVGGRR